MQILQVETFGRGGLAHYAFNLARALDARGHSVTLVTGARYELEGVAELPSSVRIEKLIGRWSGNGTTRLPGPVASAARKIEAIRDALAVARFARRTGPDLIHLHCTNSAAWVYSALLARLGVPLVSTAHVVTPHEAMRLEVPVYRGIFRRCTRVVAHSEHDRQRLVRELGIDGERVVVIPHGEYGFFAAPGRVPSRARAREHLGVGSAAEVALFFGYVREYKGLDVLLESWPAVVAARPEARLLIAGDPVQLDAGRRRELLDQAGEVGAIARFGYVPFADVATYFAAADVLVMPYRRISQSGVLFLALSLGVPVVASSVGGLPELLEDGVDARLVAPEAPVELAQAIAELLGDPELRQRFAERGRRLAAEHSWESIAERTERAYAELLAERRESA